MKHKSLYSIALCSFLLASCSEDKIGGDAPLPEGTEIQFGSVLDSNPDSRTYYDPEDVKNANATVWKIYWNYSTPLDKIYIYSPQAAAGRNQATYTVDPEGADKYQAKKVTKDDDAGIQAGSETGNYNFYALYPASAVKGQQSGNSIAATLSSRQTPSNVDAPTVSGNTITLDADMNNCLMTAVTTMDASQLAGGVALNFKPFATVVNVEVNGPEIEAATATITSVVISSKTQIAGDFSVDFSSGKPVCNTTSAAEGDKLVYVSTLNSAGEGITLKRGQILRIRVFLLPNASVKEQGLSVQVNGTIKGSSTEASQNGSWYKNLAMTNFQPSQIHTCKLPELTTNVTFDKAIWLSQLPPRTYLSEISLPGSALAFNYLMSDHTASISERTVKQNKTQTLNFRQQLAAGSRVLQAHITYINGDEHVYMANSNGDIVQNNGANLKLIDVVNALVEEMSATHGDEFCVLALSDYLQSGDISALYEKLKTVLASDSFKDKIVTTFGPETTLDDVRDKVIIKVALNASNTSAWSNLGGANALFNTFGSSAGTRVWYSPLSFSNLPTQTGGTSAGNYAMSFIYSEQANPLNDDLDYTTPSVSSVVGAYLNAYKNGTVGTVYGMTYLGGTGLSRRPLLQSSSTTSPTQVTQKFIGDWNTYINNNATTIGNTPYGWVLFNMVGSDDTVNDAITKVINHNDPTKLKKKPASSSAPAYSGSAAAQNGGQLNK